MCTVHAYKQMASIEAQITSQLTSFLTNQHWDFDYVYTNILTKECIHTAHTQIYKHGYTFALFCFVFVVVRTMHTSIWFGELCISIYFSLPLQLLITFDIFSVVVFIFMPILGIHSVSHTIFGYMRFSLSVCARVCMCVWDLCVRCSMFDSNHTIKYELIYIHMYIVQ